MDNNKNNKKNQQQKKPQGPKDVANDSTYFTSYLGQAFGGVATRLGAYGVNIGPVQNLIKIFQDILGKEATIQAINLFGAGILGNPAIKAALVTAGVSPGGIELFREGVDEILDGTRESLHKGSITAEEASKAVNAGLVRFEERLAKRMTHPQAVSLLNVEEQVDFSARMTEFQKKFCVDAGKTKQLHAWRDQLITPPLLRTLLNIPTEKWADHFKGLFKSIDETPAKNMVATMENLLSGKDPRLLRLSAVAGQATAELAQGVARDKNASRQIKKLLNRK